MSYARNQLKKHKRRDRLKISPVTKDPVSWNRSKGRKPKQ